jgi:hypothetical protein
MLLEVLDSFDDPKERKEMFEGELQYLLRYPPNTIEEEISTPDWIRQLQRAIWEEKSVIRNWSKMEDCSRMTETFAQNMTITPQPGAQGRGAGPAGRAAPTPAVRGICKGTRKPSTGPTRKRTLTWVDGEGRLPTDPLRNTLIPDGGAKRPPAGPSDIQPVRSGTGNAGRPPSGPLGKGPVLGVPPELPPRRKPATGTVVTGRSPPSSSGHIAATDQGVTANEVVDPSNRRFHANRGNETIAINADGGQMGAAGPSNPRSLSKKNDQGSQEPVRKPARPSGPRRLTESVDAWMGA